MENKVKIGLLGVGLKTYWGQFDGLKNRLLGYQQQIQQKMKQSSKVEMIDVGLVDDHEKALKAALEMKVADIEILFVFISTYSLSSIILTVVRRLNIPIILLNIQPLPAIEYDKLYSMTDRQQMTGEWLANCQACSVPEFASVFNRGNIKYDIVTGYIDDPEVWNEISDWIKAAQLSYEMRHNRLGLMGNYYGGMVDVYSDITLQSLVFGTHIEIIEMCELAALHQAVNELEINQKIIEFHDTFVVENSCTQEEIIRAAKTSVALDKLVLNRKLGSVAYYYEGSPGNNYENIVTSLIAGNTLLTGKGIPIVGEYEIKTAQAMKIMSVIGAGGCFSEFYALDFNDDIVMLGHDGPSHFILAEEQVKLVPLPVYHGKPGKGLSIQMSVKQGNVTLLSVVEGRDGISFLIAEGESVSGPILNTGNLNSRYKFKVSAKEFVNKWSKAGPSHHCAIGVGHIASTLRKYAFILGIPVTEVS